MKKIRKGNFYDSRLGGHSYSMWETGYDVCIEEDGKAYFYQLRNYDRDVVSSIEPLELKNAVEISWDELNESVRTAHFYQLKPEGTESEKNLFVYGEEKGAQLNAEIQWAEEHRVYNREITLALLKSLGHFEKVEVDCTARDHVYVIDGKWQVTVIDNGCRGENYYVEDYANVIARKKFFGRRVARLAKAAEVPWEVAVFAGYIEEDQEAIQILKEVKASRKNVTAYLREEPSHGIGRRVAAIEEILGRSTWINLRCRGQRATYTLAKYLAN